MHHPYHAPYLTILLALRLVENTLVVMQVLLSLYHTHTLYIYLISKYYACAITVKCSIQHDSQIIIKVIQVISFRGIAFSGHLFLLASRFSGSAFLCSGFLAFRSFLELLVSFALEFMLPEDPFELVELRVRLIR